MANNNHLALLKKSVNAWNEWRKKNPDIQPDLREAKLSAADPYSGADLSGADLRGANLFWASLGGADLSGADLRRANLFEAYLSGTDLSGADLRRADLRYTRLIDAKLSGADLKRANLDGVKNLTQEQLEKAKIDEKTFLPDYLLNK